MLKSIVADERRVADEVKSRRRVLRDTQQRKKTQNKLFFSHTDNVEIHRGGWATTLLSSPVKKKSELFRIYSGSRHVVLWDRFLNAHDNIYDSARKKKPIRIRFL